MNKSVYKDKLNDKNLLTEYQLIIQTGTEQLLEYPERKAYLTQDWREENGLERDLDLPKFKDKEVRLKCAFMADDDTTFWTAYDAFFNELTKSGWQDLFINDHGKTYEVAYVKTSGFEKRSKRLKNVDVVFVKFQLTLIVK